MRKTISIEETLYHQLSDEGLLSEYSSFSQLVNEALNRRLNEYRAERYRAEIDAMRQDPMVLDDISEIEEAFAMSDWEHDAL